MATTPPITSAPTNKGAEAGAIPANDFENIRPTTIAGFAKLVELVKKYAHAMYEPTAAGARALVRERHSRSREHHIGANRTAHAPGDLGDKIAPGRTPRDPIKQRIYERDDWVEMGTGDRTERDNQDVEANPRGRCILQ
jgi:hypothetical protein